MTDPDCHPDRHHLLVTDGGENVRVGRTSTTPPVTYHRTPATTDLRRSYAITVGLTPGYTTPEEDPPAAADRGHITAAALEWMAIRAAKGRPYLTGVLTDVTIAYAYPRPPADSTGVAEPGVRMVGEVSVLYAARVTDEEVVDMLDELAGWLGAAAGQERVYVTYRGRAWCLDHHPTPPPPDQL